MVRNAAWLHMRSPREPGCRHHPQMRKLTCASSLAVAHCVPTVARNTIHTWIYGEMGFCFVLGSVCFLQTFSSFLLLRQLQNTRIRKRFNMETLSSKRVINCRVLVSRCHSFCTNWAAGWKQTHFQCAIQRGQCSRVLHKIIIILHKLINNNSPSLQMNSLGKIKSGSDKMITWMKLSKWNCPTGSCRWTGCHVLNGTFLLALQRFIHKRGVLHCCNTASKILKFYYIATWWSSIWPWSLG